MEPIETVIQRLRSLGDAALIYAPQAVMALVVLVLTWAVARYGARLLRRSMPRSRLRPALVELFGRLLKIAIWIGGMLIAVVIMFPSLSPADVLAGLGIGTIAIGLAFKDIFENFLAGVLILIREPMRIGDHIVCEGVEGCVENISLRDTYIRQTDGQLVLVPNSLLFKNPTFVVTDRDIRRTTIMCGVAYGEDVDEARRVIARAVESVESVIAEKPVQVFAQAFGDSSIDFEVTWWTGSKPIDIRSSRDKVVAAVKYALDNADIEIPFPYRTLTFKDPLEVKTRKSAAEESQGRNASD